MFCDFDRETLYLQSSPCMCHLKCSSKFVDPLMLSEKHLCSPQMHVRTIDLTLIQTTSLKSNLQKGLNHIPLEPTWYNEVTSVLIEVWNQLCNFFCILDDHRNHGD